MQSLVVVRSSLIVCLVAQAAREFTFPTKSAMHMTLPKSSYSMEIGAVSKLESCINCEM